MRITVFILTFLYVLAVFSVSAQERSCVYVQDDRIIDVPVNTPVQVCFGSSDFQMMFENKIFPNHAGWDISQKGRHMMTIQASPRAKKVELFVHFSNNAHKGYVLTTGKQIIGRKEIRLVLRPRKDEWK